MAKKKILVSLIMPYFNKKLFFKESLNSALNQSFKNYEVIIIYDGGDKTDLEFIKKIIKKKKFIKLVINKKNIGAGFSRNKGINISKGKYIAFLDCDDLWKKNKLEKQIKFMKKNNSKFCHTNYYLIDENSKFYGLIKVKKELSYSKLMNSCDIGLSTVLLEKKLLLNCKFPNLKTKEDYALWLKLAKSSIKIEGLNLNLAYWRNTKNSLSSSLVQKLFDAFRVYYLYEKKNLIYSFSCVIRLSGYALFKKINSYLPLF